jgi:hypothetical protein
MNKTQFLSSVRADWARWQAVLDEAERVHQDLVDAFEELPEEHYGNPARFRDMPADWLPWQVFAGNTYEHYRDHAADVRAWLDGQITA